MEKHGLVVSSDHYSEAICLHEKVNSAIKESLYITIPYPEIKLVQIDEAAYESKTRYLPEWIRKRKLDADFLAKNVLYPDQIVYLNSSMSHSANGTISLAGQQNKLRIHSETGTITYHCSLAEAAVIEETLAAYLYITERIEERGMKINGMTSEEIDFIQNWESESYRKSLTNKLVEAI